MKPRQILAIIGIALLLAIYASTLVFALMKNPIADRLLMASIFCTVAVPVILYGMILVARNLERRGEELQREAEELRHEAEETLQAEADDALQSDTEEPLQADTKKPLQ